MSIRMMTSELRDNEFQPTGQWPEGSYCDLSWSRQKGWRDDVAADFTASGGIVMRETHAGLVLGKFERNGYNDSDFVAIVWNPEKQAIETVEYASTRGWCYPNEAEVDAPAEVVAAAHAVIEQKRRQERAYCERLQQLAPEFGRVVEITSGRGKAAPFKGQRGEICWTGPAFGRSNETRVGVRLADGTKTFLPASGVHAVIDGQPADRDCQRALRDLSYARMGGALSSLPVCF